MTKWILWISLTSTATAAGGCLSAERRPGTEVNAPTATEPPTPTPDPSATPSDDTGFADTAGGPDTAAPAEGNPPVLSSVTVLETSGALEITFTASDTDGDLDAGVVSYIVNGASPVDIGISSIASWDGSTGVVAVPVDACVDGLDFEIEFVLRDGSDMMSDAVVQDLTLAGRRVDVIAPSEDVGDLAGITYVCGTGGLSVIFDVVQAGDWSFELTWRDATSDYDLRLADYLGFNVVGTAANHFGAQPETMALYLVPGGAYGVESPFSLHVEEYLGPTTSWTVRIEGP